MNIDDSVMLDMKLELNHTCTLKKLDFGRAFLVVLNRVM